MDFIRRHLLRDSRSAWMIFGIAFCLVAFAMFGGHAFSSLALKASQADTAIVNLSGRQRMLSQRILLQALQLTENDSYLQKSQLQLTRDTFVNNHELLLSLSLDSSATQEIYQNPALSIDLSSSVDAFIKRVDHLLFTEGDARIQALIDLQTLGIDTLLAQLDQAVSQFEEASNHNTQKLLSFQKVCLLLGLTLLAAEFIIVFAPLVSTVKHTRDKLDEERKKLVETEIRMTFQASHDHLTGLFNRNYYNSQLDHFLESAKYKGKTHSLLYIDLDNFKLVNDISGYNAGDALLVRVANLFKQKAGNEDCLARLGNDEFVFILHEKNIDEAALIAESLVDKLHKMEFYWEDEQFPISASIGVCEINSHISNTGQIKRLADAARQGAKKHGKDQVFVQGYQEIDKLNDLEFKTWVNTIQVALAHNLFHLFVQKIVSTQNPAEVSHYEILIRLRDANGDTVSPARFIPCAEKYGLISAIDTWVIDNIFGWIDRNCGIAKSMRFSINVSGASLGRDSYLRHVVKQMRHFKIHPGQICFEITETAAVENMEMAQQFISTLREMGCQFAIDDFGSGLSSFTYLKEFDVNYLKIDGSFIENLAENKIDQTIVESMHNVGKQLGLETIAEYVHSQAVCEVVEKLQVDYIQGYYYSKPSPIDSLLKTHLAPANLTQDDTDLRSA